MTPETTPALKPPRFKWVSLMYEGRTELREVGHTSVYAVYRYSRNKRAREAGFEYELEIHDQVFDMAEIGSVRAYCKTVEDAQALGRTLAADRMTQWNSQSAPATRARLRAAEAAAAAEYARVVDERRRARAPTTLREAVRAAIATAQHDGVSLTEARTQVRAVLAEESQKT